VLRQKPKQVLRQKLKQVLRQKLKKAPRQKLKQVLRQNHARIEVAAAESVKKVRKTRASKTAEETEDADTEIEETIPVKKPRKNAKKVAEEVEVIVDENADIEEKVFRLIKNTVGGIYQNEVWKKTNIDSRKCSRILKKLLDAELIIREEAVVSGTKTYLLKTFAEDKKRNYDVLMVKETFSPCTGCFGECRPEYCPALTFWIMNISENPEDLRAALGYNPSESASHEIEMPPEFIEEMKMEEDSDFEEEFVYE